MVVGYVRVSIGGQNTVRQTTIMALVQMAGVQQVREE